MRAKLARIKKMLGTLLGGATGAGVAVVLAAAGVEVTPAAATAIAVLLAMLGTYLAPANAPRPPAGERLNPGRYAG